MRKIAQFFAGVRKEMKKVHWPSKKEMTTYSVATLSFVLIFAGFFTVLDLVLTGLKMLVK